MFSVGLQMTDLAWFSYKCKLSKEWNNLGLCT